MLNPFGSRTCGCITKATIGQRMFWLECGLRDGHAGLHHNAKRSFHWEESFYWDEFEWYGKEVVKKPKRKPVRAEVRDILVKPGAKRAVLAQLRKENEWGWLEKTRTVSTPVVQQALQLDGKEDGDAYYGSW